MTIAKSNGWITPTVYEGLYNALERNVEAESVDIPESHMFLRLTVSIQTVPMSTEIWNSIPWVQSSCVR